MKPSDSIADMLTRIRNAHAAGLEVAEVPYSRMKQEIARILKREGYIADHAVEGSDAGKNLRVFLKYHGEHQPSIRGMRRISTPGLRRYVGNKEIPRVLGGLGVAIMSTPKGIVTDKEARELHVGGEVLCYVW